MTFDEVVAEVVSITKRPDKINDARRHVNSMLSQASLGANFARDHDELLIVISSSEYAGNIQLTEFPRFRKIDYMLPTGYRKPLTFREPKDIFENCVEQVNSFYISGSQINYKLGTLTTGIKCGYFRYPPLLTTGAAESAYWLLEVAPYMIIDGAAAKLFRNIGDETSARQHEADWRLAYDSARIDLKYGASHG